MSTEYIIHTLCRWSCTLNKWKWPIDFPLPKPNNFDNLQICSNELTSIIRPLRLAIETLISKKEILRYHNVQDIQSMNNDEFEIWYNKNYDENGKLIWKF